MELQFNKVSGKPSKPYEYSFLFFFSLNETLIISVLKKSIKSIMHYESDVFSNQRGKYTMLTINNERIPRPQGLSEIDKVAINDLYCKS